MIKKLSIVFVVIFLSIGMLTACGSNVKLIDSKNIIQISIADDKTRIIINDEEKIKEVVDRYYHLKIESNILPEQDNGNKKVGDVVLKIEMRKPSKEVFSFELVKFRENEESKVDYYFAKDIRGYHYLTHKLSEDDEKYILKLFYGDIIILD